MTNEAYDKLRLQESVLYVQSLFYPLFSFQNPVLILTTMYQFNYPIKMFAVIRVTSRNNI